MLLIARAYRSPNSLHLRNSLYIMAIRPACIANPTWSESGFIVISIDTWKYPTNPLPRNLPPPMNYFQNIPPDKSVASALNQRNTEKRSSRNDQRHLLHRRRHSASQTFVPEFKILGKYRKTPYLVNLHHRLIISKTYPPPPIKASHPR